MLNPLWLLFSIVVLLKKTTSLPKKKMLMIDQLLTKELIVFMFKQKNGKTQLHLTIFLLKRI